jgi:hypothetical protein
MDLVLGAAALLDELGAAGDAPAEGARLLVPGPDRGQKPGREGSVRFSV